MKRIGRKVLRDRKWVELHLGKIHPIGILPIDYNLSLHCNPDGDPVPPTKAEIEEGRKDLAKVAVSLRKQREKSAK